jgi:hypothetical protein
MGWHGSEQHVRAVALHHYVILHEGLFGRIGAAVRGTFDESEHPRSHGQFARKPGSAKPVKVMSGRSKKQAAELRATYHERTSTPEGKAHLARIRGRVTGEEWLQGEGTERGRRMTHVYPRLAPTKEQQAEQDARIARHKAEDDKIKAQDEAYQRAYAKAHSGYMDRLGPEGRRLHAEWTAAHEDVRQHSSFEYPDYEREKKRDKAREALEAHKRKHGIKGPNYPQRPYRHVSEP